MVIGQSAPASAAATAARTSFVPAVPAKHVADPAKAASSSRAARSVAWGNPDSEAETAFERELQAGDQVAPPPGALPLFAPLHCFSSRGRDREAADPAPDGKAPLQAGLTAYEGGSLHSSATLPHQDMRIPLAGEHQIGTLRANVDIGLPLSPTARVADRPDVTLRITEAGSLVREIIVQRAADGSLAVVIRAADAQSLRQLRAGAAQLKRIFDDKGRAKVRFTVEAC